MLSYAITSVILYVALVLAVAGVGLAWSGILLKKDNLFEWLVPHLRRIKSKPLRNLLQCHKCVSGQFALWGFGIVWLWEGWPFHPGLLFLWAMFITSTIVAADVLYNWLKFDLKPGVPLPEEEQVEVEMTDQAAPIPEKSETSLEQVFNNNMIYKSISLKKQGIIENPIVHFPYNENAIIVCTVDRVAEGVTEEVPTSHGSPREEVFYGYVNIPGDDDTIHKLKAYKSSQGLFIMFRDTAEGISPKGRYVNGTLAADGVTVAINFNYAYNPYCEYSDNYSCPIVPAENSLPFPIEAGEKAYIK